MTEVINKIPAKPEAQSGINFLNFFLPAGLIRGAQKLNKLKTGIEQAEWTGPRKFHRCGIRGHIGE